MDFLYLSCKWLDSVKSVFISLCVNNFIKLKKKILMCRQKSIKTPNIAFHASPPVGMKLFHVDRWTDMTRLIAAIRS